MSISVGVDLEHAIVDMSRDSTMDQYSESVIEDAFKCIVSIREEFPDLVSIHHSDELNIPVIGRVRGNPEPKTDVIVYTKSENVHGISVKMSGGIQLASNQVHVCHMLNQFKDTITNNHEILPELWDMMKNTPIKMLDENNKQRIIDSGKESITNKFLNTDNSIKESLSYNVWHANNGIRINKLLVELIDNNPEYRRNLIKECMTGSVTFQNSPAAAKYIVSPVGIVEITDEYVASIEHKVKFNVRAKSHKGLTRAVLRITM